MSSDPSGSRARARLCVQDIRRLLMVTDMRMRRLIITADTLALTTGMGLGRIFTSGTGGVTVGAGKKKPFFGRR